MAKVMLVRDVYEEDSAYRSYENITDGDIDNLDDLMIEYSGEELVVVEDNYVSPERFNLTEIRHIGIKRVFTSLTVARPDHALHQAPSLKDWLANRELCASEVSFNAGIIACDDTWSSKLLEE